VRGEDCSNSVCNSFHTSVQLRLQQRLQLSRLDLRQRPSDCCCCRSFWILTVAIPSLEANNHKLQSISSSGKPKLSTGRYSGEPQSLTFQEPLVDIHLADIPNLHPRINHAMAMLPSLLSGLIQGILASLANDLQRTILLQC